jgi:hypothetical protein
MSILPYFPDNLDPNWLVSSGVAYNVGDLLYDNGSGGIALPAGSQASQGSELADQILFASNFIGVCVSGCPQTAESTANTSFPLVVDMGGRVWNCTCPSQTFNHGDLVGIYSDGVHSPVPQEVDACGQNLSRAIGKVFGYYSTATTQVAVIFFPRKYNSLLSPNGTNNTVLTVLTGSTDAIPPHTTATYLINTAGVDAMTLAAPTTGTDDGLVITLTSNTANAHTLTATSLLQTGGTAVTLLTWPAHPGASVTLMAVKGKWNIISNNVVVLTS